MTPVNANGTHAKDIALHFVERTSGRATRAVMGKTVRQAKSILESGYTKDEIITCIDYAIDERNIDMYSLGYISASINALLKEIEEKKHKEEVKQKVAEMKKQPVSHKEVVYDGESKERNRAKLHRFGAKSGFGEKLDLDMFKES